MISLANVLGLARGMSERPASGVERRLGDRGGQRRLGSVSHRVFVVVIATLAFALSGAIAGARRRLDAVDICGVANGWR